MQKKLRICLALLLVVPGMLFLTACHKKPVQTQTSLTQQEQEAARRAAEDKAKAEAMRKAAEAEAARQKAAQERLAAENMREQTQKRQVMSARQMFITEDIYFEFDSSALLSMAQDTLNRKADWLRQNPDVHVTIEGHCDERGTNEYNLALGERRAESAKTFLADLGISSSRLSTISYGEERPMDTGSNEQAWAKNRRANFLTE